MSTFVVDLEAVIDNVFLADLNVVGDFLAVERFAPSAFVEAEFGIPDEYFVAMLIAALKGKAMPRRAAFDERTGKRRVITSVQEALRIVEADSATGLRALAGPSVRTWLNNL